MGKIKDQKYRVHKKVSTKPKNLDNVFKTKQTSDKIESLLVLPDNPFSGLAIDVNQLVKPKPSSDTCSISGKSQREVKKAEQNLPKKEKRRLRHDRFLEKLEITYASKKKKKPKKKGVDMAPLLVSLPEISSTTKPAKPKIPIARPSMKTKKRLKHDLSDLKHFRTVLDDSVFRKNPAAAIKEFLLQKIAEKRPDLQLKTEI